MSVGVPATVDVSSNFSDADGDTLTYTATSSDEAIATVSVSSATVTVTPVAAGSATITVTATDPDGLTVDQTFSATVTQPNRAPTAVGTIADQALTVGGDAATVDVSSNFSDADSDTLTYTAASSDEAIATVSVSDSTVTITAVAAGSTTITVTATDPDNETATQTIAVTVTQPNRAPAAVGTIADQALDVGGSAATVDVSSNFSDADNDTLTYTAASSDEAIATVSVSESTVTITAVAAGSTTITVTATDPDNETATQTIAVTVTQPNRAPTAVGTIADQTVTVSGLNGTVDVSGNFSDPDGDTLTYTAASSDAAKAAVSVSGATVTIRPVTAGSATVTVTATDPDGLTAEQTFSVTVKKPNQPPNVVGTIPNQTLNVGDSTTVDISSTFSDPDGDTLTYTVSSSDTSIATASVSGTTVTITPVAPGTATIGVTATDPDGLPGIQNISVTVPNRAPTRVGSYSDVTLTEGAIDWHLIVRLLFSDPDGESLTYSASTSDTVPVDVNMVQNGQVLSVTPKSPGSVVITITATDPGGLSATQSFNLRVVGPNRAPEAEGTISDSALEIGGSDVDVDVSSYFTDPNSDTLTYTAASSDTSIATVSVSSATVTITAVGEGTATITVTATDPGDLTADQTFSVTVTHPNRAPAAVGTIADQSPTVGGTAGTVDVSANFSDADGDTLTYTATSSDTAVATVEVSSATVSITAVSSGSATITVTATDPDGLSATQTFSVATNRAPTVSQTIPDYKLKKHWQLEGVGSTS